MATMVRSLCTSAAVLIFVAALGTAAQFAPPRPEGSARESAREVGNQACRPCHQAIVDSYARTAMARTSGAASVGLEGAFQHAASGVSYRVLRDGQSPRLTYERADRAALQGAHALKYYLGSNTRGRTFLFDIDGFLYQSPINYYAGKKAWDMSPGYANARDAAASRGCDVPVLSREPGTSGETRHGAWVRRSGVPAERRRLRAMPWARRRPCGGERPGGHHQSGQADG
jgi:hypothetical protein